MKQSGLYLPGEAFPGSDVVQRFTFKTMQAWDNCALLAVLNNRLAMAPVSSRGQSAHFKASVNAGPLKKDCFECLTPHELAA